MTYDDHGEPEKRCGNCEHEKLPFNVKPCKSCDAESNWKPKPSGFVYPVKVKDTKLDTKYAKSVAGEPCIERMLGAAFFHDEPVYLFQRGKITDFRFAEDILYTDQPPEPEEAEDEPEGEITTAGEVPMWGFFRRVQNASTDANYLRLPYSETATETYPVAALKLNTKETTAFMAHCEVRLLPDPFEQVGELQAKLDKLVAVLERSARTKTHPHIGVTPEQEKEAWQKLWFNCASWAQQALLEIEQEVT